MRFADDLECTPWLDVRLQWCGWKWRTDRQAVQRSQACREGYGRSMDKFSFGLGCVGGWGLGMRGTSSNSPFIRHADWLSPHNNAYRLSSVNVEHSCCPHPRNSFFFFSRKVWVPPAVLQLSVLGWVCVSRLQEKETKPTKQSLGF